VPISEFYTSMYPKAWSFGSNGGPKARQNSTPTAHIKPKNRYHRIIVRKISD